MGMGEGVFQLVHFVFCPFFFIIAWSGWGFCNFINNNAYFFNQYSGKGFNFIDDVLLHFMNFSSQLCAERYIYCYNQTVASDIGFY